MLIDSGEITSTRFMISKDKSIIVFRQGYIFSDYYFYIVCFSKNVCLIDREGIMEYFSQL